MNSGTVSNQFAKNFKTFSLPLYAEVSPVPKDSLECLTVVLIIAVYTCKNGFPFPAFTSLKSLYEQGSSDNNNLKPPSSGKLACFLYHLRSNNIIEKSSRVNCCSTTRKKITRTGGILQRKSFYISEIPSHTFNKETHLSQFSSTILRLPTPNDPLPSPYLGNT